MKEAIAAHDILGAFEETSLQEHDPSMAHLKFDPHSIT